jgi:hypothetical protein
MSLDEKLDSGKTVVQVLNGRHVGDYLAAGLLDFMVEEFDRIKDCQDTPAGFWHNRKKTELNTFLANYMDRSVSDVKPTAQGDMAVFDKAERKAMIKTGQEIWKQYAPLFEGELQIKGPDKDELKQVVRNSVVEYFGKNQNKTKELAVALDDFTYPKKSASKKWIFAGVGGTVVAGLVAGVLSTSDMQCDPRKYVAIGDNKPTAGLVTPEGKRDDDPAGSFDDVLNRAKKLLGIDPTYVDPVKRQKKERSGKGDAVEDTTVKERLDLIVEFLFDSPKLKNAKKAEKAIEKYVKLAKEKGFTEIFGYVYRSVENVDPVTGKLNTTDDNSAYNTWLANVSADSLQKIFDKYVKKHAPGMKVTVVGKSEGEWRGTKWPKNRVGVFLTSPADIENADPEFVADIAKHDSLEVYGVEYSVESYPIASGMGAKSSGCKGVYKAPDKQGSTVKKATPAKKAAVSKSKKQPVSVFALPQRKRQPARRPSRKSTYQAPTNKDIYINTPGKQFNAPFSPPDSYKPKKGAGAVNKNTTGTKRQEASLNQYNQYNVLKGKLENLRNNTGDGIDLDRMYTSSGFSYATVLDEHLRSDGVDARALGLDEIVSLSKYKEFKEGRKLAEDADRYERLAA